MTTPNNQPTPPPGMAILTDYTQPLPKGAMRGGNPWMPIPAWEVGKLPWSLVTYAIPITPTVPATGDTTNEKGGDQRQDKAFLEAAITEQIAHAEHWKEHYTADPNGAEDKAYWNGRHTAFQEAMSLIQSAPVEQRQELQITTLLNSAFAAIGEYLIAFNWHHDETSWEDENAGQWMDPITHRTHDIDYAFTLQLQRQLLCK